MLRFLNESPKHINVYAMQAMIISLRGAEELKNDEKSLPLPYKVGPVTRNKWGERTPINGLISRQLGVITPVSRVIIPLIAW